jgi:hypothetical protein
MAARQHLWDHPALLGAIAGALGGVLVAMAASSPLPGFVPAVLLVALAGAVVTGIRLPPRAGAVVAGSIIYGVVTVAVTHFIAAIGVTWGTGLGFVGAQAVIFDALAMLQLSLIVAAVGGVSGLARRARSDALPTRDGLTPAAPSPPAA